MERRWATLVDSTAELQMEKSHASDPRNQTYNT